jgi:hypothetical protein
MDIVTGPIHVTTALAAEHRRDLDRELGHERLGYPLDGVRTSGPLSGLARSALRRAAARIARARRLVGELVSAVTPWPGSLAKPPIDVAAEKGRRGRRSSRPAHARPSRSRRAAA